MQGYNQAVDHPQQQLRSGQPDNQMYTGAQATKQYHGALLPLLEANGSGLGTMEPLAQAEEAMPAPYATARGASVGAQASYDESAQDDDRGAKKRVLPIILNSHAFLRHPLFLLMQPLSYGYQAMGLSYVTLGLRGSGGLQSSTNDSSPASDS